MPSRLLALIIGAVTLFVGGTSVASGSPTELFFSEYIEGSSNNKALEIYNGTGSTVDLDGYTVQMYFNGSATAGLTISLLGSIAPNDVFVLAHSSANATILAQADQTNGAGWFNGDDAVVLRNLNEFVDVIGQVGIDPGTEWGSGLPSTADNTLRRKAGIEAGDANGADAFDPSIQWDGFAQDTFDGLGVHTTDPGDAAPFVSSTTPAAGATNIAGDASVTVTFSEPVNVSGDWFSIVCSNTGAHPAAVSGGPTIFTVDPASTFGSDESCTVRILATQVSDQDGDDPPDTMAADHVLTFQTVDLAVCGDPATKIYDIQGDGSAAAITGNVTVEGVVVGDFEGGAGLQGFYLQDPTGDGDATTSDGIFVFTDSADLVSEGQLVRVTGFARERFGETTLNGSNSNSSAVTSIVACGTGDVEPTDVLMPFSALDAPERYEGMLVRFPQSLVISEYFNYDRFGELVLALPLEGESRPFTPTLLEEPGPAAQARLQQNQLRRITLDDGLSVSNPALTRHPNGDPFSLSNRFRGGDTVENAVGVLGFSFSLYRIQPTAPADYTAVNPRPGAPAPVGGRVQVAAFNMLNYFLTLDYPSSDPRDNTCGASQDMECRGADSNQPDEFERQRVKLLEALSGLDADVVGVNEIENTPGVDPLADIAAGLNSMLGAGTYDRIDTGVIGTDAIRVGLLYKPGKVVPIGDFAILDSSVDPRFIEDRSRPALAQTFEELASGARFTVVVNHLKSKGSVCDGADGHFPDPDTGDGQGNCNVTRTLAAQALVDWLATDPTGSGDPDFLITGDLNAYAMEDPIDAIKAGPDDNAGTADDYTNLIAEGLGPFAYSFVFDGMAGYLDHALSNASLTPQVTGVTEWHINADEPDLLDYDTSFKSPEQDALYEPNAFRSSDHDPVLVGLEPQTTFAGLCRATERAVSDADVAASLCDKLRAAESADARGNSEAKAGALRAYVRQVRAQTGKTISAEDAELLIELAGTL